MKTIDIKKIIRAQGLNRNDVALQLFPKNKFPRLALNRVMAGLSVLDADQISKFSLFSGLPIADLFDSENWKAQTEKGREQTLILTSGDYRAELDTATWTTKIFHKESLFHEFILHNSSLTLKEYVEKLEETIKQKKQ